MDDESMARLVSAAAAAGVSLEEVQTAVAQLAAELNAAMERVAELVQQMWQALAPGTRDTLEELREAITPIEPPKRRPCRPCNERGRCPPPTRPAAVPPHRAIYNFRNGRRREYKARRLS